MRDIFVLYPIDQVKISDHQAYGIYGAFTAVSCLDLLAGGIILIRSLVLEMH